MKSSLNSTLKNPYNLFNWNVPLVLDLTWTIHYRRVGPIYLIVANCCVPTHMPCSSINAFYMLKKCLFTCSKKDFVKVILTVWCLFSLPLSLARKVAAREFKADLQTENFCSMFPINLWTLEFPERDRKRFTLVTPVQNIESYHIFFLLHLFSMSWNTTFLVLLTLYSVKHFYNKFFTWFALVLLP